MVAANSINGHKNFSSSGSKKLLEIDIHTNWEKWMNQMVYIQSDDIAMT
jgi:hypothetical protein